MEWISLGVLASSELQENHAFIRSILLFLKAMRDGNGIYALWVLDAALFAVILRIVVNTKLVQQLLHNTPDHGPFPFFRACEEAWQSS